MYKAPYTVFLNGLDDVYDYIVVDNIKRAVQIWADERNAIILDNNATRVDVEDIKAILNW